MKEITIVGYCDGDHEEKVRSSVEREVSVDGSKPVALDLCEGCDALVTRLLELMERGVVIKEAKKKSSPAVPTEAKPAAAKKATAKKSAARPNTTFHKPTGINPPLAGPHICPECGFESVSRTALGQHLISSHQKGFRDYPNQAATDNAA